MILAVTNQKGGTGKSTIATNLAVCFARSGAEVLLVDADPQHSALDWRTDRPDELPLIHVVGLPVDNLHREIPPLATKFAVLLIDGGGRITATARAAVSVADFVIVPTLPSKPDLLSTQDFFTQVIEEVRTHKTVRAGIVLNRRKGTILSHRAEEQLRALAYPSFETMLHDYTAYGEAYALGLGVVEYAPTSKAAKDILALFAELQEGLA
jgi:chromosome partitioning protein